MSEKDNGDKWQGNDAEFTIWSIDTWDEFYQAVLDDSLLIWDEGENDV